MPPITLDPLVTQVRAILADPQSAQPPMGAPRLDVAVAALAQHRHTGKPLPVSLWPYWFVPPPDLMHMQTGGSGQDILGAVHLLPTLDAACQAALSRPGRLFSATPAWAWTFLAWVEALEATPRAAFLPAAVACECLAAGCDQLDATDESAYDPSHSEARANAVATGGMLLRLAQDLLAALDLPAERRVGASVLLSRAVRRALDGQQQDVALRQASTVSPDMLLAVLHRRSGTLVAVPCQCAALLAGASWRTVALAGRFGHALGCAAQLEDDLADQGEDARMGRKTLPTLLAHQYPAAPEVVEATTWVLMQCFLREATGALTRLPVECRESAAVWSLVPASLRGA